MADTSARMLRLLSLLQTHRSWPGGELAERLDVSARTLRRDIDRLRSLGYPVQAARGVDGGYQLAPGAMLPPLVLDDDEAVALVLGMQVAAQGAVPGIEEAALRALTTVTQVMPARLRRRVDALRSATVATPWQRSDAVLAPETLVAVAQACRDGERLAFRYTARDRPPALRSVEPHRLVPLGRRWYLVAYDLDRHDWRSFRLDRMDEPKASGSRFRSRELPAADAAQFVRAGMRDLSALHAVEAIVEADAELVASRVGRWFTVEALGARRCRVRGASDELDWPAMAFGMIGAEFTVLSPPELVDLLRDWGGRFARATTVSTAAPGR
jgi:predicted DNA-binding transcriptional regulator YafY